MRFQSILTGLLCAASLGAQEFISAPRFPSPEYFRQVFSTSEPRAELQAPARLQDFVVDGKLELSLRGYLELVLANNTEIAIQKLSIETQKNAIMRAFAPFDPAVVTSFRATRTTTPSTDALAGAATVQQLAQPLSFSYQQTLETGTQYNVGFSGTRTSTNNAFATFNPALSANMNFSFTQPLLRNRGAYVNRIPIMVARSRLRGGHYTMQDQVMRLLATAENAYWAVVESRESLRVQEEALELARKLLERAQRELELGATSRLDIYRPQQNYANQEISVTQARYRLAQVEDALRRQMGADLDPDARRYPLLLTEPVLPPEDDRPLDAEGMLGSAFQHRNDLRAMLQNLDIDDLNHRSAQNNLRPDLSFTGTYTSTGRGGPFLQRTNIFAGDGTRNTVTSIVAGGLSDAVNQVFNFNYPIYGFTLSLRLPIRDRRASADLADAVVNKRLNMLRARNLEQTIRLEVLNAVNQVESSKASVRQAKVALEFAEKSVEAEQMKYDLGVTTIFFLLDAQNVLTRAQADLVTQSSAYRRNLTNLLRVTGQLLNERGVVVE